MNENIYGRKDAIEVLNQAKTETESVMVGIYGRRRIGKTYLIDQYFGEDKPNTIFLKNVGIKKEPKENQIKIFVDDINDQIQEFNKELNAIRLANNISEDFKIPLEEIVSNDWEDFFRFLSKSVDNLQQVCKDNGLERKVVYFFDEVPYAAESERNFANRLGAIWESRFKNKKNFIFVLCGSAASWMIKEIADTEGGLSSRCKYKIPLKPFKYNEMVDYLDKKHQISFLNEKESVKTYMCIGGVAKYLDFYAFKQGLMFNQTISELMFSDFKDMRKEFDLLMESIFNKAEIHKNIIHYLAGREKGASKEDILRDLSQKGTPDAISNAIKELVDCDYLEPMKLIRTKSTEDVYRLIDEYCRFYFKWIFGQGEENFHSQSNYWNNEAHNSKIWFGTSFEVFCFRNKDIIKTLLQLNNFDTRFFSFNQNHNGGAEGDMVIEVNVGKKLHAVLIVENKFKESEKFSINEKELKTLINKITVLKGVMKYDIDPQVIFITSDGVIDNTNFKKLRARNYTIADFRISS